MRKLLTAFVTGTEGQDLIEYALLAALVALEAQQSECRHSRVGSTLSTQTSQPRWSTPRKFATNPLGSETCGPRSPNGSRVRARNMTRIRETPRLQRVSDQKPQSHRLFNRHVTFRAP